MIKKFCGFCGTETWHNPGKPSKLGGEPPHRCVSCGMPRRSGAHKQTVKLVPGGKPMVVVGS